MLEKLNKKETIIIIGRAHSGTRILPEAMRDAGIFMGTPLNVASDLLPADDIYEACRIFGKHVTYQGNYEWDFSKVCEVEIPIRFITLLENYLQSLIRSDQEKVGWKIPNNTLIYPWLTRLLPNATFIFWVRHPEASCSKMTGVDRLEKWNIPCKKFLFHEWNYKMRAISWKYHYDIVVNTHRPNNFLKVRFEDYVLNEHSTKQQIEQAIGVNLKNSKLDKRKAEPLQKKFIVKFPFLDNAMKELNYM